MRERSCEVLDFSWIMQIWMRDEILYLDMIVEDGWEGLFGRVKGLLKVKRWGFGDALVGMGVSVVGVWRVELGH
jgi:hypothetical protein